MNTKKDTSLLFASESTILRIASIAKIVSWIILLFYLVNFADNLWNLLQQRTGFPLQPRYLIITFVSLFSAPVVGLFHFLVLQAVAQGLNLGLDIYYDSQTADHEE